MSEKVTFEQRLEGGRGMRLWLPGRGTSQTEQRQRINMAAEHAGLIHSKKVSMSEAKTVVGDDDREEDESWKPLEGLGFLT